MEEEIPSGSEGLGGPRLPRPSKTSLYRLREWPVGYRVSSFVYVLMHDWELILLTPQNPETECCATSHQMEVTSLK